MTATMKTSSERPRQPVGPEDRSYQRDYFSEPTTKPRMTPVRSRYVQRHLQHVLTAAAVEPGARILEIGCGMGRFSLLLAERGYHVTGADLSADLLEVLRRHDPEGRVETVCCDVSEADRHVEGPFDAVLGFFMLHHLRCYDRLFGALAALLPAGGPLVLCEPNAYNPSFYVQILLTPGMTFRGDGGVARMRPGIVRPALECAGFGGFGVRRYGLFPPVLANRPSGARVESLLERWRLLRPILAFQIFSARRNP